MGDGIQDSSHQGQGTADAERTLDFHLSARSAFHDLEVRAATSGDERWWSLAGRPVYDSYKNFCGFRGHGTDLTEKRRSEQQVSRLAHYDSLTGLANRVQMSQALEQILAAPSGRERACAVLMLDLDRFKHVNDTLGHAAGDELLQYIAGKLRKIAGERGALGRVGGDEFAMFLPGPVSLSEAETQATKILETFGTPAMIAGRPVHAGISIGISTFPDNSRDASQLMKNADIALYQAKESDRGRHVFFRLLRWNVGMSHPSAGMFHPSLGALG